MEVTSLSKAESPQALRRRQIDALLAELDRHWHKKERRGRLTIEDKALHFRVERIVNGSFTRDGDDRGEDEDEGDEGKWGLPTDRP